MKRFTIFLSVILALGTFSSMAQGQLTTISTYERHNVGVNWGDAAWFGSASVSGLDTAHANTGSRAMKVQWTTTGGFGLAGIRTNEFLSEKGTGLSTGFTAQVYVERVSGTGTPQIKIEATNESGGGMGGPDTALTLDSWTQVTLPAGSITANHKQLGFIFIENGSNGQFNFWIDTIQREGVMWDDFEVTNPTRVAPSNVAATHRGEATLAGSSLATAGPTPTEDGHAFGMTWSGEGDAAVEIQHLFSPALDLTGITKLRVDMYVAGSTIPTNIQVFFWDGSTGAWSPNGNVTANDAWETIEYDITGIGGVPAFDITSVDEAKIVITGLTNGTVFVDKMQTVDDIVYVDSIIRASDDPTTDAASVDFTVSFTEPVSNFTASDCSLTTTGKINGASVSGIEPSSGPSDTYTVTVDTGTGDGNIRLDVVDRDTVTDSGGYPLGGTGIGNGDYFEGEYYAIYRSTPPTPLGDLVEEYETHNLWTVTEFGDSKIVISGYDGMHYTQGSEALKIEYTTTPTVSFRGIACQPFPEEIGKRLDSGFEVDLYVEAVGGATGVPMGKIELVSAVGGGNDNTGDVALSLGSNTLTLNPTKNYNRMYLLFIDGGASGTFNIWIDDIRRDGALWEGFESSYNTQIFPSNIDGSVTSERTLGGVTLADPGPIPIQSNHAFRMSWTGESDGKVEINHLYPGGLSVLNKRYLVLDVFFPNPTTLPTTFGVFFTDGVDGSFHTAPVIPDTGQWHTLEIDLAGIAAALDETAITELKVVIEGTSSDGTVYLDNMRLYTPAKVDLWKLY